MTFHRAQALSLKLGMCALAALFVAGCNTIDSPLSPRGPQRRVYIGPTLGFGVNTVGGEFHTQSAQPDCQGFTGGSGSGPVFGLAFDYWFQQSLSSNGIVVRALLQQMPSTFESAYGKTYFLNKVTKQPTSVNESNVADVDYSVLNMRISYMYSIPSTAVGLELGPTLGMATKLHIRQHLKLVTGTDPDVTFGDDSQDSTVYEGDPATKSGIRFGFWAGVQYKFDIGWWIISPYLGFDLGFTKALSTSSWSVSSAVLGVDFKYGIK